MCLIAFALNAHPRYRFVLAANRDEFHARPTAAAAFHDDGDRVFGGRDLQAGGSWLLASRAGRIAAVTNVRTGLPEQAARSRGALVRDSLDGDADLATQWRESASAFGRYNLLCYADGQASYASNHPGFRAQTIEAGVHSLSNAALDTPWPKTLRLRQVLQHWVAGDNDDIEPLLRALADPSIAPDHELPDTGVGMALERRLSAAFIVGEQYGTRASSIVLVDDTGIRFVERSFGPNGSVLGTVDQRIILR
jgi:uncharacterized protein with NRDE domain